MTSKTRKQSPQIQALASNQAARPRAVETLTLVQEKIEKLREEVAADAPALKTLADVEEVKTMLQEVANLLLANHLQHCVLWTVRSGDQDRVDAALGAGIQMVAASTPFTKQHSYERRLLPDKLIVDDPEQVTIQTAPSHDVPHTTRGKDQVKLSGTLHPAS